MQAANACRINSATNARAGDRRWQAFAEASNLKSAACAGCHSPAGRLRWQACSTRPPRSGRLPRSLAPAGRTGPGPLCTRWHRLQTADAGSRQALRDPGVSVPNAETRRKPRFPRSACSVGVSRGRCGERGCGHGPMPRMGPQEYGRLGAGWRQLIREFSNLVLAVAVPCYTSLRSHTAAVRAGPPKPRIQYRFLCSQVPRTAVDPPPTRPSPQCMESAFAVVRGNGPAA